MSFWITTATRKGQAVQHCSEPMTRRGRFRTARERPLVVEIVIHNLFL